MDVGMVQGGRHLLPVRVYYEDTDAGGVVYYANYLKYAERGRSEFLRAAGFENSAMLDGDGVALAVRRVNVEYLRPARLDDELMVETAISALKGASVEMAQTVRRGGEVLIEMTVTVACMTLDGRPTRLPKDLRDGMARFTSEQ